MPDGNNYVTYNYKMRSSGLIPIDTGKFLNQTFGVDKFEVTTYEASKTITKSDDMVGGSSHGKYISAQWQRLPFLTEDKEQIFSGKETKKPEFVEESEMPGQ